MSEESDMVKVFKTNPILLETIAALKKVSRENDAPIWRDIAKRLERSRKNWSEVNVSKLILLNEGETAVIAGKLLGAGLIDKAVKVAVFSCSDSAAQKITGAGGEVMTIPELAEQNPKGTNVRIMG
jgi:large subunit ribosomal protein L18e